MSEILEKNLSFIKNYNKALSAKVSALQVLSKDFDIQPNLSGEYNLLVDGIGVHSITGAQKEAEEIFSGLPHNTGNSLHVIFGLGLGYLADVFSENSKGNVIVYEPDVGILRVVLDAVDFSLNFQKRNIYFVSDLTEFNTLFEELIRYKTKVSLSSLGFYGMQYEREYEAFLTELECKQKIYNFNFQFQAQEIFNFWKMTVLELNKKYNRPLLVDFKDALKDKPAIIVSAGPSLNSNLEILEKYKDNAYIFCVGTALKTMYNAGITPDFLNLIEKYNTSLHYDLPFIKDITLISEPFTHFDVYKRDFKGHLLTVGLETDTNRWFLETAGKELTEFETKGTVSYQALYSAHYLGCNPIVLLGQDLAYSNGECYSAGSVFEDLVCNFDEETQKYKIEAKDLDRFKNAYFKQNITFSDKQKTDSANSVLEKMNNDLITVDGQNDNKLPTTSGYSLFIEYFKDFAARNSGRKLINSSSGGALIKGFEAMSLEKVFEDYAKDVIDKSVVSKIDEADSSFDKKIVVENIKKDLNSIIEIFPLFERGKTYAKHLKNEMERTKTYTEKVALYMKKSGDLYAEITNKYTNVNRVLRSLSLKENYELSYLMKENCGNYSYEIMRDFYEKLNDYFALVYDKLLWTRETLETAIKELENESSCAKG